MRPHSAVLVLLLSFVLISDSVAGVRIINGRAATSHQWEWMVALIDNNQPHVVPVEICGASLIAADWLLTAAHCMEGESIYSLSAWIGDVDLSSISAERIAFKRIIVHPQFKNDNNNPPENDIALVQLTRPATQGILRISNAYNPASFAENAAVVMGWGTTSTYQDNYPLMLQQTTVPITSNALCNNIYAYNGKITDSMVCAGFSQGGTDACTGDSGSPLVVQTSANNSNIWQQVGIVSYGEGCAQPNRYGVYTRVSSFENFIQSNICNAGNTPPAPTLRVNVQNTQAQVTWDSVPNAEGYQLFYAPYSEPMDKQTLENIRSLEVGQQTQFATQLSSGQKFYVAVKAYKGNCNSAYSNVGVVKIP
ncbi:MAG: serine protease [Thiotrichaceae bacterium]|nr:serine protease [Thiotrichaceae bacterium]